MPRRWRGRCCWGWAIRLKCSSRSRCAKESSLQRDVSRLQPREAGDRFKIAVGVEDRHAVAKSTRGDEAIEGRTNGETCRAARAIQLRCLLEDICRQGRFEHC